jgi:MFS family permease
MHNERYAPVGDRPLHATTTLDRPTPGTGRRHAPLGVLAVLVATAGLGLSYGVGYTATTLQFAAWGAPGWLTGLAGAAPSLAVLLLVPFAPVIAGRVGVVPAMLAGAVLGAISFALLPVLDGPGWWLLLRFLAGAGLTLPWLLGETWINLVTRDQIRGRVLALYTVVLFGAWAVGPELLARLGTTPATTSALGVAAMAIAATPLALAARLAPRLPGATRVRIRSALGLAPFAMAAALAGGVAEFGAVSLLPVQALAVGLDQDTVLRLLSLLLVGGIALQPVIGWLADRVDRGQLLGGLGAALAVLGLALAVGLGTPGVATVTVTLLGGVVMGFYTVGLTLLGEQVRPHRMVAANAAFLVAYEAGATVGPVAAGAALDRWPSAGLGLVLLLAGLTYAGFIAGGRRTARNRASVTGSNGRPKRRRGARRRRPGHGRDRRVAPAGRRLGPGTTTVSSR